MVYAVSEIWMECVKAEKMKQLIHSKVFHETLTFEPFLQSGLGVLLSDADVLFNVWKTFVPGYKQPQILCFVLMFHLLKSSIRS